MKMDTWRIACVGAGLIGQGWTTLFSSKGYQVILQDVSKTALEDSLRAINKNLMFLIQKSILIWPWTPWPHTVGQSWRCNGEAPWPLIMVTT